MTRSPVGASGPVGFRSVVFWYQVASYQSAVHSETLPARSKMPPLLAPVGKLPTGAVNSKPSLVPRALAYMPSAGPPQG